MFGMLDHAALTALEAELKKSADVGYQTPASGGGSLSALVPQSIEGTLTTTTFSERHAVLWKDIPKGKATQTVHEYAVVSSHGNAGIDPFFSEGGVPGTQKSEIERKSVRIKFIGERREVTDVGTVTGLIGPNPQALAHETREGTVSLIQKLESALWHGNSALNSNQFDGAITQIKAEAPQNVENMDGAAVSLDKLLEIEGKLVDAPNYGDPGVIYTTPKLYQELDKQIAAHGRHSQIMKSTGEGIVYGRDKLSIMGSRGAIPIKAATFLNDNEAPVPSAYGEDVLATPVVSGAVAAPDSASRFVAADAGDYIYKAAWIADRGVSAPVTSAAVTVAAGDKVTLTLADPANTAIKYVKIYRTKAGAAASTAVMIGRIAAPSGAPVVFTDYNQQRPDAGRFVFAQNQNDVWEFVRLLDLIRRPLAEVQTTKPFLLMLFGALAVKAPKKMYVLENVGINAS